MKFFCGLLLVLAGHVSAEEGRISTPLKDALKNKRFVDDRRISDQELKAQSGSLSRYSLKFDLNYAGPPVTDLANGEMPNPDNRPRDNRTSLSGFMGARYRLSPQSALGASTGLRWYSPYHQLAGESVAKPRGAKDHELANPQLNIDRFYRFGGVQMRSAARVSAVTQDFYLDRGQFGALGVSQSLKWAPSDSRWILGLGVDLDQFLYNREFRGGDGRVSNYYLTAYPSLEYRLSGGVNFKTSFGLSYANLRRKGSWWKWEDQLVTQRVGIGWAVTREIYLNPYLNYFVDRPALATTSASFSTVFSIF